MRPGLSHLGARLSRLAYESSPRPGLLELGFDLVRRYDKGSTQAMLVTDYVDAWLIYQGTGEKKDVLTDLKYIKCDWPEGGRVHQGFYQAFVWVQDEIEADLKRLALPKVFAGHSLGGGLTLMAASKWKPRRVLTYGCPRTGNDVFVDTIECPVYRHENWFDGVTFIPPRTSPWQIWHSRKHNRPVTLYKHAGKRIGLGGFGHGVDGYVEATA